MSDQVPLSNDATTRMRRRSTESREFLDVLVKYKEGKASGEELVKAFFTSSGTYMVVGALLIAAKNAGWFGEDIGSKVVEQLSLGLIGIPALIGLRRLMIVTDKLDALYQREADPEVRLKSALDELLVRPRSEHYGRDVARNCENLILAVAALIGKETWTTDSYARFLSSLVGGVVGRNAQELSKLVQGDQGEREFLVPDSAAELADKILEEQMKAMNAGDLYLVVSDVGSWKSGQLDDFVRETENAVKRGVKVQRIFNLLHHDEENPLPSDAGDILRAHLRFSATWSDQGSEGGYEVKLLGPEEYRVIKKKIGARSILRREIADAHFGVFRHADERLRFRVRKSNLSKMKLCRDPEEVMTSVKIFNTLWPDSAELSENLIKSIEERIKRPPDGGG